MRVKKNRGKIKQCSVARRHMVRSSGNVGVTGGTTRVRMSLEVVPFGALLC